MRSPSFPTRSELIRFNEVWRTESRPLLMWGTSGAEGNGRRGLGVATRRSSTGTLVEYSNECAFL